MSQDNNQISNKPLNPTDDYEEFVGGETDSRAGVTKDFNRAENQALEDNSRTQNQE